MYFDDLNNMDDDRAVSPLSHDYAGRFSRKGIVISKKSRKSLIENILVWLFITTLLATDFILFAGSGNIEVFHNSIWPIPEVSLIIIGFAAVAAVLVFLLRRKPRLRSLLAAVVAWGFVYALFQQFSQILPTVTLGAFVAPTHFLIGLIAAAVTYTVLSHEKLLYKVLFVIATVMLFLHVYINYMRHTEPHEFIESHNTQKTTNDTEGKKFIFFMFPNLVSYPYLSTLNTPEAKQTQQIMQGFYQKNNFKVYPQAYAMQPEYLDNMILSFNPLSAKPAEDHILRTKLLAEYWRFHNLRHEYIYLKHNQLYDIFRKNQFQISAYKSRDFDMCHAKHKYNVNRCIEKVNQPTNIYSMSLSTFAKIKILMVEWFSSLNLVKDLSSLYNTLTSIGNVDQVPMVGVNYNNLYVVNSTKTFDILLENIKEDRGKQAYFVFVDIPSNMYIYDEFCRLKPQGEWLDMANLPWIKNNYTPQRQTAYLQQTRCLYGKLEQFIQELKRANLWDDTIMVLQGTSGVNNFENFKSQDFAKNFIANQLVSLAVHDNQMQSYEINMSFCPTNKIITEYLFKQNTCSPKDLGVHTTIYDSLRRHVSRHSAGVDINYEDEFRDWYAEWAVINHSLLSMDKVNIIRTDDGEGEFNDSDFGLDDLSSDNAAGSAAAELQELIAQ